MKKNFLKTISITLLVIMLFSNLMVFADSNKWDNKKSVFSKFNKEYVTKGEISDINSNILSLGEKSNKMMFKISDKTTILDAKDAVIKSSDLKKGINVEIVYNKASRDKKNKLNNALSIKVINTTNTSTEIKNAVIKEISVDSKKQTTIKIMYETINNKNKIVENFMLLTTDKNTEIYNQNEDSIKITTLKEGMIVNVEHSLKMTKTVVPQAYLHKISIVKNEEKTQVTVSKILNVYTNNKKSYILVGDANNISKQILFILDDKVTIKNKLNQNILFEDLAKGLNVKIIHSTAMTYSLPPQSTAYSIQVLDDLKAEFLEDVVIDEVNYSDKAVTISYDIKVGTKYQECKVILYIDDKTTILDKNGKAISLNNLKLDMLIDVKHEYLPILSSPPKSKAIRLSVVSDSYQEPIDAENCSIFELLYKLYYETDVKEWRNCIKNHNHNWKNLNKFNIEDFMEDFFEKHLED